MKSSVAERVELFLAVRDQPYQFDLVNRELNSSCFSKMKRLQLLLHKVGIASHSICCRYRWDSGSLPQHLLAKAPIATSSHYFLRVHIPETRQWVNVDPTFDKELKNADFPIAEWDGLSSTIIAVKPFISFLPETSDEICSRINAYSNDEWQKIFQTYGGFYNELNNWIAKKRSGLQEIHA